MTSLRVKGWTSDGTLDVPADTLAAMAELVDELRKSVAENATLRRHSDALRALLHAIEKHGVAGEEFADAYRAALAAIQ